MIGECLEGDRCFGVCLIRYGSEVGGPAEPYLVGTEAEILAVRRLPDGRMNLVAAGRRRFRVVEITQWQPHIVGDVAYLQDDQATTAASDLAHQVRDQLVGYMQGQIDLSAVRNEELLLGRDLERPPTSLALPRDPVALSHAAAALLEIPAPLKQELLEENATAVRLRRILHHLWRKREEQETLLRLIHHPPPDPDDPFGGDDEEYFTRN